MGMFDDLKKAPSATKTVNPSSPAPKTGGGLFDDLKAPPKAQQQAPPTQAPVVPMPAPKGPLPIVARKPLAAPPEGTKQPMVPNTTLGVKEKPLEIVNTDSGSLAFSKPSLPSFGASGPSTLQEPTPEQIAKVEAMVQPVKEKLKKKGVANLAAQTAVVAASQTAKAGKFFEDLVRNKISPDLTDSEIAERDRDSIFAPLVRSADDAARGLNTESKEWQSASTRDKFSKDHIAETIYNTVPQVAGSAATFLLTGGTGGFLISAGSTAEDVKQKAKQYGVSEQDAEKVGLVTGLAVGLVDKLSFDKVLPKEAKAAVAKGIVSRLLSLVKSGAMEATTEALQENVQIAAEKTFREDLGWDEVASRNAMSAFGGLFGGVGTHSIGALVGGETAPRPEQRFEYKNGEMVPVGAEPKEQSFEYKDGQMVPVAAPSTTPSQPTLLDRFVPPASAAEVTPASALQESAPVQPTEAPIEAQQSAETVEQPAQPASQKPKMSVEDYVDAKGSKLRAKDMVTPSTNERLAPEDRNKLLAFTDYVAANGHRKEATRNYELEADITDILQKNGEKVPTTLPAISEAAGRVLEADSRVERALNPEDAALVAEAKKYPSALAFIESQGVDKNDTARRQKLAETYTIAKAGSEKFRLKDDLAKKGIEVTDEQEQQIQKLNEQIFGDTNVKVMGQILANKEALGKYESGIIEILGGQADPAATFYHESVHKYLDVFTDRSEYIDILKEGQKKYGIEDFGEVEERIAEDFIKYAKTRTGVTGKLRTLFDQVLGRINDYIGNNPKIESLYRDIVAGKAKKQVEAEAQKNGIKIESKPAFTPAPKPLTKRTFLDNPVHDRILKEMTLAERGRRIAVPNIDSSGFTFSRQASTFPKWVPSKLRRRSLFDAVLKHFEDGTLPTKADEKRLYQVVSDEMEAMDEVVRDEEFVKSARQNVINPFATDEENAAALAKFDEEYAKLKSNQFSRSSESGTEIQTVGEPISTSEQQKSQPTEVSAETVKPTLPPKKSAVGKSIEEKAIEKGLVTAFSDTAQYTPVTIKDQSERVAKLMESDIERAKRIVKGDEPLPEGMLAGALIVGMEKYALENNDPQLALDIANSPLTAETSIHAQELRMLAERDPSSAVANLQKLKKIKEAAAEKKSSDAKRDVVATIKKRIKKETKATKETWASFIDSIQCT